MNPVIEAFRGAAALLVMLHHYSYQLPGAEQPGNWSLLLHFFHNGVDLFFVITGFLFAPLILQGSSLPARAFVVRRAFRLYPLYVVSLALGAATLWGGRPDTLEQLAKHLLFIQTLPFFPFADIGYFSMVYWTLPVEVGFYALLSMALWFGRGARTKPAAPLMRLVVLGLGSMGCFVVSLLAAGPVGSGNWIQWQAQLPALLIEFWFGLALYTALPVLARQRNLALLALFTGLVLFVVLFAIYPPIAQGSRAPRPFGPFNVFCALGYALVLGACLGLSELRRQAANGPLARAGIAAGSLSYGIYLFHDIALGWVLALGPTLNAEVRLPMALTLTLVLAAVLHKSVEEPMRVLGRRLSAKPHRSQALAGLPPAP